MRPGSIVLRPRSALRAPRQTRRPPPRRPRLRAADRGSTSDPYATLKLGPDGAAQNRVIKGRSRRPGTSASSFAARSAARAATDPRGVRPRRPLVQRLAGRGAPLARRSAASNLRPSTRCSRGRRRRAGDDRRRVGRRGGGGRGGGRGGACGGGGEGGGGRARGGRGAAAEAAAAERAAAARQRQRCRGRRCAPRRRRRRARRRRTRRRAAPSSSTCATRASCAPPTAAHLRPVREAQARRQAAGAMRKKTTPSWTSRTSLRGRSAPSPPRR